MEEVVPKMAPGEARMRDSQGGGESDPAEGVRRRCMNRGSEVETIHSG